MNILAPVRRDRVLTELPQVCARATSGFGRRRVWAGRRRHWTGLGPNPAAQPGQLLLGGPLPTPTHPPRPGAARWRAEGQEWVSPILFHPTQCLRKEAALHVHKDFQPRVTCACQEHRTGTVG